MSTELALMTAEEFLALPNDDGQERELIRGELRERQMTYRSDKHALVEANVAFILKRWFKSRDDVGGNVFSGEVGCVLDTDPDTVVGIDAAYFSAEVVNRPRKKRVLDGAPILAVEIQSPSNNFEETHEKVRAYLDAGVKQVWEIDPFRMTLQMHQPDELPVTFNASQRFDAGKCLPGLSFDVKELFE